MDVKPDLDLLDLTRDELKGELEALGVERYRGDQLFRWLHGRNVSELAAMTDLGKSLRERLAGVFTAAPPLSIDDIALAQDGTRKLRLQTRDGRFIESVLIPDNGEAGSDTGEDDEDDDSQTAPAPERFPRHPKLTLCISSQVGCALDCRFCATAALGLGRQLTAGEIVAQVHQASRLVAGLTDDDPLRRAGADHLTNLVFMGMGEPLHNFSAVSRALTILTDPLGPALSPRRITVSTAGLVPGIARLGALPASQRPNLAISLNASTDAVRDEIMPINRKWPLAKLIEAVARFPLQRRRRITFEYVLLAGVNDSTADAQRLPRLLRGIPAKLNLIPWNPHPHASYRRPSEAVIARFRDALRAGGLAVYVRRPRGDDIAAACGQLAAQAAPLVALRPSRPMATRDPAG